MTKKMKLMRKALSGVGLFMALTLHAQNEQPLYKDMNAPIHDRVMDLLSRMTVEEKVSLMIHNAPNLYTKYRPPSLMRPEENGMR